MGCDIHLHVELLIDGKWVHYNHLDTDRNYYLFSKMADVRSDQQWTKKIVPISKPKGLPDNLSDVTLLDLIRWESDAHSQSWLSSHEVAELYRWMSETETNNGYPKWFRQSFGYLFSGGYEDFHKNTEETPEGIEDFRFVFWFDN